MLVKFLNHFFKTNLSPQLTCCFRPFIAILSSFISFMKYALNRIFELSSWISIRKDPGNEAAVKKTVKKGILMGSISCVCYINSYCYQERKCWNAIFWESASLKLEHFPPCGQLKWPITETPDQVRYPQKIFLN